jgi:NMD protein affecting ribosome stability and mRNA decay
MVYVAQVAFCTQTNTKHINTVWVERTVVKIFNLLVHIVTSGLLKVNA